MVEFIANFFAGGLGGAAIAWLIQFYLNYKKEKELTAEKHAHELMVNNIVREHERAISEMRNAHELVIEKLKNEFQRQFEIERSNIEIKKQLRLIIKNLNMKL